MKRKTATPLTIGGTLGFKVDDKPMNWPSEGIELSDEQAQHLEQTGSVALATQAVDPGAKDHKTDPLGFPVGLSDREKHQDHLQMERAREREAKEAEQADDPHHAAWARLQAHRAA